MNATLGKAHGGWATFADRAPQVTVIGIALSGSVTNILDLCARHGVHGLEAWSVSSVIDLTAMIAAYERQRDKAINRPRRGWLSFPTLLLVGDICLSLSMQLAVAHPGAWSHIISTVATVSMLMIVFMLERRAAHEERMRRDAIAAEVVADATAHLAAGTQNPVPGTGPAPVPGTQPVPPVLGTGSGTQNPVPGGPGTGTPPPAVPASTAPVLPAPPPAAAPPVTPPARNTAPPPVTPPAQPPVRTAAQPPARPQLHDAGQLPDEVARLMRAHKREHGTWMKAKDLRAALGIAYSLTLELRRQFLADEEAA